MAVIRYFGLPRCGKTTLLSKMALEAIEKKQYKNVYCNVHLSIPGVIYVPFRECFGTYEIVDGLYLIDEAAIEAGDREYKSFGPKRTEAMMLHGHDCLTLVFFSQEPDGVDKKIRSLTEEVYYIKKSKVFRHWTYVYRIPYKLIWPPKGGGDGENAGRILMGYVKPPIWSRIFALRFNRKPYYNYFDSWERVPRPPLPAHYGPYVPAAREPEAARGRIYQLIKKMYHKKPATVQAADEDPNE